MASIKDVAEMAGVSLSTASIVANGKAKEHSECVGKNAPAGRVTEVCRCVVLEL